MGSNKTIYPLDFTFNNTCYSFELTFLYQPDKPVLNSDNLSFTDVITKLSIETNIDFNLYMISDFSIRKGGGFTIALRDEDVIALRMYTLNSIIEYKD